MDILINDYTYDHPERDRGRFLKDLRAELSELGEVSLMEDDVPEAADWPVVLAAIATSLGAVFLSGKLIRDNLDAWLELGRRLKAVLEKARAKYGATRIDGEAASVLALAAAAETEDSAEWRLLASEDIPLRTFDLRPSDSLTHHPNTVFIRAFRSKAGRLVLVVVRSTGECRVVDVYDYFDFG